MTCSFKAKTLFDKSLINSCDFFDPFRSKVKTVTFLLPVDDIYTNRPVLTKHQEGPKITELASISETDS